MEGVLTKDNKEIVGTRAVFTLLTMAAVSWMYKSVKNSQFACFKFMQFMICQLHLNKAMCVFPWWLR